MALKFSTSMRNALVGAIEAVAITGGAPRLMVYSGSAPAIAAAATGTLIVNILINSTDWLGAASNGSVTKANTWSGSSLTANVAPGYFRLTLNDGTTTLIQGDIPEDMSLATPTTIGQTITIDTFTLTAGNT